MSEYQYYEFQTIDRPLTEREMRQLRACSTRATITPTRFVNHYEWGDFKGDVAAWVQKYFDAFVYVANWGTHELALRFPRSALDLRIVRRYLGGGAASVRSAGDFVTLRVVSESDASGDWDDDGSGWLSSLIPIRADIAAGDLRALYLIWLLGVQERALADAECEPPIPPGLGTLTAPLTALVDFLRIDMDLLTIAAARSTAWRSTGAAVRSDLHRWIASLPEAERMSLLTRVALGEHADVHAELRRRHRGAHPAPAQRTFASRTAGELRSAANDVGKERRQKKAARAAKQRALRDRAAAVAREQYLDTFRELPLLRLGAEGPHKSLEVGIPGVLLAERMHEHHRVRGEEASRLEHGARRAMQELIAKVRRSRGQPEQFAEPIEATALIRVARFSALAEPLTHCGPEGLRDFSLDRDGCEGCRCTE
ncbi:hypothetical protein BH09GEM1_BH09GEM1_24740 [soil metagenome]